MTAHAFIDESRRNRMYLLCASLVDPASLAPLRRAMKTMLMPGQREIHCKQESGARRRQIADRIAQLPVETYIYLASVAPQQEEAARQRCLLAAVADLLGMSAHRLVLDTRDTCNIHDVRTLQGALGRYPSKTALTYEHLDSTAEPLLWIADVVAWCYGAGGDWQRRVRPVVSQVRTL